MAGSLNIFAIPRASVALPAAGRVQLFMDSDNNDHLTQVDSNGVFIDLTASASEFTFDILKASTGTLSVGQVVYPVSNGSVMTVELAQADSTSTMPSAGIVVQAATDTTAGKIILGGTVTGVDTSSFLVGDELYVSDSVAGDITNVRPTTEGSLAQKLGKVLTSAVSGSIWIYTPESYETPLQEIEREYADYKDRGGNNPSYKEGRLFYNEEGTLRLYNDTGVRMELGRTLSNRFQNIDTVPIVKGDVLYVPSLASPGVVGCKKAVADSYNQNWVLGVAGNDAAIGETVEFIQKGVVEGVDTSSYATDVPLYLGTTAGALTDARPEFPALPYVIGTVVFSDAVNGVLGINIEPDQYLNQFDGCIIERHDTFIVVDGPNVYMDIEKIGGGDLPIQLGSKVNILDCTTGAGVNGRARVALTAGTATDPQYNLVYIDLTGGVATLKATTTYPTQAYAAVGSVSIRDAATVSTEGPDAYRRTTSAINHNGRGAHSYQIERWAVESPKWFSGVTPTASINTGTTPDTLDLSVIAGIVYQTHRQSFPALSVVTDGIYVANGPGTPSLDNYTKVNNLTQLAGYTSQAVARNTNCRGHIVVFGAINKDTSECKLYANLPSEVYGGNDAGAYFDPNGTASFTVPDELRLVAFLIAQIPYDLSNAGNDIAFINPAGSSQIINLLGNPIGISGGASGSGGAFIPPLVDVLGQGNDAGGNQIKNIANATDAQDVVAYNQLTSHTGDSTIHFTEASIDHTNIQNVGTNTHAQIDSHITTADAHIASTSNPHSVTLDQATTAGNTTTNSINTGAVTSTGAVEGTSLVAAGPSVSYSWTPGFNFVHLLADGGSVLVAYDSGDIEIPNGNLDMSTNQITNVSFISSQNTSGVPSDRIMEWKNSAGSDVGYVTSAGFVANNFSVSLGLTVNDGEIYFNELSGPDYRLTTDNTSWYIEEVGGSRRLSVESNGEFTFYPNALTDTRLNISVDAGRSGYLTFKNGGSRKWDIGVDDLNGSPEDLVFNHITNGDVIYIRGDGNHEFYPNNDFIITPSAGDVGIKNANPAYDLDVTGDINITGTYRVNGTPLSTGGNQLTTVSYSDNGALTVNQIIEAAGPGTTGHPLGGGTIKRVDILVNNFVTNSAGSITVQLRRVASDGSLTSSVSGTSGTLLGTYTVNLPNSSGATRFYADSLNTASISVPADSMVFAVISGRNVTSANGMTINVGVEM